MLGVAGREIGPARPDQHPVRPVLGPTKVVEDLSHQRSPSAPGGKTGVEPRV